MQKRVSVQRLQTRRETLTAAHPDVTMIIHTGHRQQRNGRRDHRFRADSNALYLAGVHPQREARAITAAEARALYGSLRTVLRDAIRAGGTTIRDYRNAEGKVGGYARKLYVYGRDGDPCLKCEEVVQRVVFSNRSAFFCPTCQP